MSLLLGLADLFLFRRPEEQNMWVADLSISTTTPHYPTSSFKARVHLSPSSISIIVPPSFFLIKYPLPCLYQVSKMRLQLLLMMGIATSTLAQTQYTSTASTAVAKARATALTESPTSNVVGTSFNRFVTIWCENTDYSMAAADSQYLLSLLFPPHVLLVPAKRPGTQFQLK